MCANVVQMIMYDVTKCVRPRSFDWFFTSVILKQFHNFKNLYKFVVSTES